MSYLSTFWDEADEAHRTLLRRFVQNGQLEIATGGWVMTEEGVASFPAMIDQLVEGHQWLAHTFPGIR